MPEKNGDEYTDGIDRCVTCLRTGYEVEAMYPYPRHEDTTICKSCAKALEVTV